MVCTPTIPMLLTSAMPMPKAPVSGITAAPLGHRTRVPELAARAPSRQRRQQKPATALRVRASSSGSEAQARQVSLSPSATWSWEKPPPKASLRTLPTPQDHTAQPWVLNLVQLLHWAGLPPFFLAAYFIFSNSGAVATALGGSLDRAFLLLASVILQGLGPVGPVLLHHEYEGWQTAPFQATGDSSQYSNQKLMEITLHLALTFQTIGVALFNAAVFGLSAPMSALLALSFIIPILGPKEPKLNNTVVVDGEARRVMPVAQPLFILYNINFLLSLAGHLLLFQPIIASAWPPPSVPWLGIIPPAVAGIVLSLAGQIITSAGVAWESMGAWSDFDQFTHVWAGCTIALGIWIIGATFWLLTLL